MCSHPRTGDATDEKIAEKNREKFNELNFWRLNHGLRQRVATQAIFAARWRRDNFKKSHHHRKQKIARVAAALVLVLFLPLTGYVTSFYLAYLEDCLFNTMSLCVNVRNVLIAIPVLADTGYIHGNRRFFISTRTRSTERK